MLGKKINSIFVHSIPKNAPMPRYKIKVKSSQQVAQVWVPVSAMSEAEAIRISQARCAGRGFAPDLNTITQILTVPAG